MQLYGGPFQSLIKGRVDLSAINDASFMHFRPGSDPSETTRCPHMEYTTHIYRQIRFDEADRI